MEKINIMKEYYNAMEQERIRAYFQPQYTTNGFEIVSAEALCRMILPNGVVIMPESFISRLEYTGEICSLDWFMVDKVCRTLSYMRLKTGRMIPVSVNLSRRHTHEWDTAQHLSSIVDAYDLDHSLIEIEITETNNTDDLLLKEMVESIRSKGFRIAVDDFGSGYSSLGFIRGITFDTLKLDKSLLSEDCNEDKIQAIIRSIVKMSKSLGVKTVIEGVENEKQLGFLNCCGADLLQGDFLSKALPEYEFINLLKDQDEMRRAVGL